MTTTALEHLNGATAREFSAALGAIFEHSPWVAERTAMARPFATVTALHEAMMAAVLAAPEAEQMSLLQAHPELAGPQVRAGSLTAASTAEQSSLGLQALDRTDTERFAALNAAYTKRFGFPFIVCVRNHTRDAIIAAFERRLPNYPPLERLIALDEVAAITRLRLVGRVSGPGMPSTTGHLSTHVLDIASGKPARGVRVDLHEVGPRGDGLLVSAVTNADGRTDAPLISGVPLRIGAYELHFHAGDYFRALGHSKAAPAFLDVIPVRFAIAEPTGRYHIPLLAGPWSYSTYRGS